MNPKTDIHDIFKKKYFWETDVQLLDSEDSKQFIIDRVFSLGDIDDINLVIEYYGEEETLNVLLRLNYLDPKTLNLVSKLFNESRENFRCQRRKLSKPQHWNS
mgnify:CR=1 FL=1